MFLVNTHSGCCPKKKERRRRIYRSRDKLTNLLVYISELQLANTLPSLGFLDVSYPKHFVAYHFVLNT